MSRVLSIEIPPPPPSSSQSCKKCSSNGRQSTLPPCYECSQKSAIETPPPTFTSLFFKDNNSLSLYDYNRQHNIETDEGENLEGEPLSSASSFSYYNVLRSRLKVVIRIMIVIVVGVVVVSLVKLFYFRVESEKDINGLALIDLHSK